MICEMFYIILIYYNSNFNIVEIIYKILFVIISHIIKIGWSESSIESTHKPEKPTDLPVLATTRFYDRGKYEKFMFSCFCI